jgi:putative membrane protein
MFIDYVTLMLLNAAIGFFLLACYLSRESNLYDQAKWAPAFGLTGFISLISGFRMIWTWPLPGAYNIPYGEMSVLFGGLLLAAAVSMAKGWDLKPLGIYGLFAGIASVVVGAQFIRLGLSKTPMLAGVGFILSGLAGVFSFPVLQWFSNKILRGIGIVVLGAVAAIWVWTSYSAYGDHLASFAARH